MFAGVGVVIAGFSVALTLPAYLNNDVFLTAYALSNQQSSGGYGSGTGWNQEANVQNYYNEEDKQKGDKDHDRAENTMSRDGDDDRDGKKDEHRPEQDEEELNVGPTQQVCPFGGSIQPDVDITVSGNNNMLKGVHEISVEVDHASEVDIYRVSYDAQSLTKLFIGSARRAGDSKWKVEWDTRNVPNGSYVIVAEVRNCYGVYGSNGPAVTVKHEMSQPVNPLPSVAPLSQPIIAAIESAVGTLATGTITPVPSPTQATPLPSIIQEISQPSPAGALPSVQQEAKRSVIPPAPSVARNVDSDGDGLTDEAEKRIGTHHFNPDTDGDGYIDGLEVARGYNPLVPSPGDKIVFVEPKDTTGEVREDVYQVTSVAVEEKEGQEILVIGGKARPLTFVTLFVYSDLPLVMTVLTDENGNFRYELSKTLDDGEHQVYIALTDSEGYIVEKSSPLVFVKTAQAVTVSEAIPARVAIPEPPPQQPNRPGTMIATALGLMIVAVILMIIMLTLLVRRRDRILTTYTSPRR